MRYNSTYKQVEICNGKNWQPKTLLANNLDVQFKIAKGDNFYPYNNDYNKYTPPCDSGYQVVACSGGILQNGDIKEASIIQVDKANNRCRGTFQGHGGIWKLVATCMRIK